MLRRRLSSAIALTLGIAAPAVASAQIIPSGNGCSPGPVTSYMTPIVNAPSHIHVIHWGWATHGNPSDSWFQPAFNQASPAYGILGTRWMGTVTQYRGNRDGFPFSFLNQTYPINPSNASYTITTVEDDIHPVPTTFALDPTTQFLPEAQNAINSGLISISGADDITIVMYPPGLVLPGNAGGWHSYSVGAGNVIALANPGQNAILHELVETISDPEGSIGQSNWHDAASCEIGDRCPGGVNIQVRPAHNDPYSGPFQTQTIWSNEAESCVYGRSETAFEWGVGTNHQLFYQVVNAKYLGIGPTLTGWSQFGNAPAQLTGRPAATSSGPGRVDTFALDTSGNFWHGYSDNGGANANWEGDNTDFPSVAAAFYRFNPNNPICFPDAASVGAGNQQVFAFMQGPIGEPVLVRDMDDNQGWTGWQPLNHGNTPASKISAAAFGANNVSSSGFPSSYRTVMLSYIDVNHQLWVGQITDGTTVQWANFSFNGMFTPVDSEIVLSKPGRYDVFIRATDGSVWQAFTEGGAWNAAPSVVKWSSSSFNQPLGAIGLGDQRFYLVGTAGAAGSSQAMGDFFVATGATGFVANGGAFLGGIDVSSW